jgi:hypothetical protein
MSHQLLKNLCDTGMCSLLFSDKAPAIQSGLGHAGACFQSVMETAFLGSSLLCWKVAVRDQGHLLMLMEGKYGIVNF